MTKDEGVTRKESALPDYPKTETAPRPISLYVILGAVLFAFNPILSLFFPILLSFLLVLLICHTAIR